MEILCFFIGVAFFCIKKIHVLFFLLVILLFKPRLSFLCWFLVAVLWSFTHQQLMSDRFMPQTSVISHAILQGYIVSIPSVSTNKTQFQFQAEQLDNQPVQARVLLSCFKHCPDVRVGQTWQLHVKLKKPQNLSNPGGFDYVSWLRSRHITWTGFILGQAAQQIHTASPKKPFLTLRQTMADTLASVDPDLKTLGIIQALTLGVTSHIEKDSWDLFRRTGTTHLMVISGSHIGLVAGLTYGLVNWLWCRLSRLCLLMPASKVASLLGFLMAAIYAILAGFEVPSQRALIVCFFMFIRPFCSQRFGVWQSWRYALFTVLVLEPHSVMMPGFYLSFLAVAILVLINQRYTLKGLRKTIVMQLACLVGLMPLTLFWFSYGAINGLIANLLAIPWVSFIIVPLGLFTAFTAHWFVLPTVLVLLTHSIDYLFYYLTWIDSYSFINLTVSLTQFLPLLAIIVVLVVAVFLPLPQLFPVMLITAIAACCPGQEKIKQGEVKIDVMDVGQGLAVVVHTAKHRLIYDTGMKFYQGSDMGQIAIIPYLKTLGVNRIDKIVISHPDLDHRGGLASLEKAYHVDELIVDDPMFYQRGTSCHQYSDWSWDGVLFHFFPIHLANNTKNNSSCVLQIKTPAGQVLLSGDIEKSAEQYLVNTYRHQLASSVLVIPHHGSKTSSSMPFVSHVSPLYAIASYGFDNRYHFPHKPAMDVYTAMNIPVYNTVNCGMVSVRLNTSTFAVRTTNRCDSITHI